MIKLKLKKVVNICNIWEDQIFSNIYLIFLFPENHVILQDYLITNESDCDIAIISGSVFCQTISFNRAFETDAL